jgi:hypothetical protein
MFIMNLNTYGTVIGINPKTSLIAVRIDSGDISILEVEDTSEFEINDVLYGGLEQEGDNLIFNKTGENEHDVYIQATGCNFETAHSFLFSK